MLAPVTALHNFLLGGIINPDCNYYIGKIYEYGTGFVKIDILESIKYFEKAYNHEIKCTKPNIGFKLGSQYCNYADKIFDQYNIKDMKDGGKKITKLESGALTEALNYYTYSSTVSSVHAVQFGKRIHEGIFKQTLLDPLVYFKQAIDLGMDDTGMIKLGIFYFLIF